MLFNIRYVKKDRDGEWIPSFDGYSFRTYPYEIYAFCKVDYYHHKRFNRGFKFKRGKYYKFLHLDIEEPYELQ